jgi:hypothetical protein
MRARLPPAALALTLLGAPLAHAEAPEESPAPPPRPAGFATAVPETPRPPPRPHPPVAVEVIEPDAGGGDLPTLANASWLGSVEAEAATGGEPGLWFAAPLIQIGTAGWITGERDGRTLGLALRPRLPGSGPPGLLSAEAAAALGLRPGEAARVGVYVRR